MSEERLAETHARLRELTEPLLAQEGLELVDLELRRGPRRATLRVTIDIAGKTAYRGSARLDPALGPPPPEVSVEDCARASRLLSPLLDVEDLITSAYVLEVTSPGINRALREPRHFQRALGLDVRVRTRVPCGPAEESFFIAPLSAVDADGITLDVRGTPVIIPFRLVAQANIEYRF